MRLGGQGGASAPEGVEFTERILKLMPMGRVSDPPLQAIPKSIQQIGVELVLQRFALEIAVQVVDENLRDLVVLGVGGAGCACRIHDCDLSGYSEFEPDSFSFGQHFNRFVICLV